VRAVLATANAHKAAEFEPLLPGWELEPLLGADFPAETGATYRENALAKARFGRGLAPADAWVLGDDSGIEVEALDWGPGVVTARFGGDDVQDRAALLLEAVGDNPRRAARMVCVLALATPGAGPGGSPRIEIFHGEMNGELARQARGEGGFGYDPVFLQADGRTNAELPADEKDAVSHRGRAVAAAMPRLRELLQAPA